MANKRRETTRIQTSDRPTPEQFLTIFPPEIRMLADKLRALVTRTVTELDEAVYMGWRLIGY